MYANNSYPLREETYKIIGACMEVHNEFEIKMAKYTGSKKAVACVNGTSALHLALKLVGVVPGDEVITQALTFIATANAISYCSAKPIFLDVDKDTLRLSPNVLRNWLETNTEQATTNNKQETRNKKTVTASQPSSLCIPMASHVS